MSNRISRIVFGVAFDQYPSGVCSQEYREVVDKLVAKLDFPIATGKNLGSSGNIEYVGVSLFELDDSVVALAVSPNGVLEGFHVAGTEQANINMGFAEQWGVLRMALMAEGINIGEPGMIFVEHEAPAPVAISIATRETVH